MKPRSCYNRMLVEKARKAQVVKDQRWAKKRRAAAKVRAAEILAALARSKSLVEQVEVVPPPP